MSTTLLFGSFDGLHAGHRDAFRQAAELGERLLVVVARDGVVKQQKGRAPVQAESERLAAVQAEEQVSTAQLGGEVAHDYQLLRELDFDTLAVGYDQEPDDRAIKMLLAQHGKPEADVVRLQPFQPETFKSSKLRHV